MNAPHILHAPRQELSVISDLHVTVEPSRDTVSELRCQSQIELRFESWWLYRACEGCKLEVSQLIKIKTESGLQKKGATNDG